MTTKSNILASFNHSNGAIAESIAKLMAVETIKPSTFRLSVITPDDVIEEGNGQYRMEAQVVLQLLNTAASELVSSLNRVTSKDALLAQYDRHRHNSGWDDQYDGGDADTKQETEQTIEEQVFDAIDRYAVVLAYGKHIAAIKGGGAEWLTGFETSTWVPNPGLKDCPDGKFTVKQVLEACASGIDLEVHIMMGRVNKTKGVVENRLVSFTELCKNQVSQARTKKKVTEWTQKVAYASTMGIFIDAVPVNDACNYIGDMVSRSAFNRKTSRLEDAVRQVGNSKYLSIAYALKQNIAALHVNESELNKTFLKVSEFLPYSDMLQKDIASVVKSEEWLDHQLELDIKQAAVNAKANLRQAMRDQVMFDLEKQALESQATNNQAAALRAMIAQQRAELYAPKPTAEELAAKTAQAEKKAAAAKKAAATKKAKAAEKAKQAKGVKPSTAPTPQVPKYNTAGPRSTTH